MGISTVLNSLFLFTLLQGIFFMLGLFGTTLVQWLLLAFCGLSIPLLVLDFLVFQQFKFHINSFVLKVILQPNIFENPQFGLAGGGDRIAGAGRGDVGRAGGLARHRRCGGDAAPQGRCRTLA